MEKANVDMGPGLHVLRDPDPARRAAVVAQELGVTVRSSAEAVDDLLAGLPSEPVGRDDIDRLDRLARRLHRLAQVADRTFERTSMAVSEKLVTAAGGLAIHPETVRARAAAVEEARARLVETEREIGEQSARSAPVAAAAPDPSAENPVRERRGPSLRARQSRALGALLGSFGLALVAMGAADLPLWAALVVPLLVALWAVWYLRDRDEDDAPAPEDVGTSRLAEVAATTEMAFGQSAPPVDADRGLALLQSQRSRAEEDLRVAERAWADLAGPDVDVADVEEVVKRFDAQHTDAAAVAATTSQVRATRAVLDQVEAEWAEAWRALGQEPPAASEAVMSVGALRARATRPVVLTGAALTRAEDVARVLTLAPVVAVEPGSPVEGGPEPGIS